MAKSSNTSSFSFGNDFIALLNAWSFVTKKDKSSLLQEAFAEYIKMEQHAEVSKKASAISDILKGN